MRFYIYINNWNYSMSFIKNLLKKDKFIKISVDDYDTGNKKQYDLQLGTRERNITNFNNCDILITCDKAKILRNILVIYKTILPLLKKYKSILEIITTELNEEKIDREKIKENINNIKKINLNESILTYYPIILNIDDLDIDFNILYNNILLFKENISENTINDKNRMINLSKLIDLLNINKINNIINVESNIEEQEIKIYIKKRYSIAKDKYIYLGVITDIDIKNKSFTINYDDDNINKKSWYSKYLFYLDNIPFSRLCIVSDNSKKTQASDCLSNLPEQKGGKNKSKRLPKY